MTSGNHENLTFLKSLFPFNLLEDSSLHQIAPLFERVSLAAGSHVFREEDAADALFFIISGKVRITLHKKDSINTLSLLSIGDHFGEDSLGKNAFYSTAAVCETRVLALRISHKNICSISNSIPKVWSAFSLFQKTYRLARKISLPWRSEEETLHLISRRHPFFLFLRVILIGGGSLLSFAILLFFAFTSLELSLFLLILSILVLGLGVVITGWAALEWTNDYFIITRDRVLVQKQLIGFFESRHESPVSAILSTGIDTSVWGRMFGFGSVTMRSYTGDLRFARLPFPHLIYELLEYRRQQAMLETRHQEQAGMRSSLMQRLEPGVTQKKLIKPKSSVKPTSSVYQTGSFSDLLAKFFNLRYEKEGSVILRTHWWILLRKTALPGLFLLLVILGIAVRLIGFFGLFPETLVYLVALFLSLAGWGWWFYQYLDWHNDIYILTHDQLIDVSRKPLGSEERRSAPIKNIQTVEFTRKGLIGLILNFGTVRIQIGNEELTFDNIYNPSQVQSEIYMRFKEFSERMKRNEQQRLADWIKTYDEIRQEKSKEESSSSGIENE